MARIGLQLYTVKEDAARDLLGTIAAVGRMGYEGVEFAGVPEEPAGRVRDALADAGLAVAGIVVPMEGMRDAAAFAWAIEYSQAIGNPAIVFPWLDEEHRGSEAAYRRTAATLNEFGRGCRHHGCTFIYHVHGYEFDDYGGRTGLDILMQETDQELVGLEPDTYWIERGGADALQVYRKYAKRTASIHFKDAQDRAEWRDVEVGTGIMDTAGILRAARGEPAAWFIVEQEQFTMPSLESAAISCRNLKRLVEENYRS